MTEASGIRWGWLRFMYLYTIAGAGGIGLAILLMPGTLGSMFGWPAQDPVVLGITGSVYVAFALVSVLGLRSPLKFAPVLLLQLAYKTVWFVALVIPLWLQGKFPAYATVYAVVFATYVIGDLIAVPFGYLFARKATGG